MENNQLSTIIIYHKKILLLYKFKLWFLGIQDDFIQDKVLVCLQEWGQLNKNFQCDNNFSMFVNNGSQLRDARHFGWHSLHNLHTNNSFTELGEYLNMLMDTLNY